jgi:hypothetical protein
MINQYIARGQPIKKFVLLVDGCLRIQEAIDSHNNDDIHQVLRDCLLSKPITLDDGSILKVDLVMTA